MCILCKQDQILSGRIECIELDKEKDVSQDMLVEFRRSIQVLEGQVGEMISRMPDHGSNNRVEVGGFMTELANFHGVMTPLMIMPKVV